MVGAGPSGGGCLMRVSDRFVLASTVAVLLISFTARPITTDSSYLGLYWLVVLVVAVLLFLASSLTPARGEPWYAHYVDLWRQGLLHMQTQSAPMDADAGVKIIF